MSNRTAASVFGRVFRILALNNDLGNKDLALKIYSERCYYDFEPCEMFCDESLVVLGLARLSTEEDDTGEDYIYHA